MNDIQTIGIVGGGTMGHGIAHVAALAGNDVTLYDIDEGRVNAALAKVRGNLDKGVDRGKVAAEDRDAALARLKGATRLEELADADLVVEAIPEKLELKRQLFRALDEIVRPGAVLATNTSSLSIAKIADGGDHPERVIGTHFFNPVHIMALLEVVVHDGTAPSVLDAVLRWGTRIGKECITVRDFPGFATSRLGVCLGMEAIRMVEQGVASAEDIDKAMVLGYRHPVGPLRLTDMVGLDVRLAIGEYLARELGNAAFEPPALMRRMVAEGRLGQKSGEGFYRW
ncbi:MAG: 3-hydroxyacyl-CoA dehydrogenase family protein [Myxococcota bacterium]